MAFEEEIKLYESLRCKYQALYDIRLLTSCELSPNPTKGSLSPCLRVSYLHAW